MEVCTIPLQAGLRTQPMLVQSKKLSHGRLQVKRAWRPEEGRAAHLAGEAAAVCVGGLEQHIGRLEVTIDHPQRVQVVHASRHVDETPVHRFLHSRPSAASV